MTKLITHGDRRWRVRGLARNMPSSVASKVPLAGTVDGSGCTDRREILLQGQSQHISKYMYFNNVYFEIRCHELWRRDGSTITPRVTAQLFSPRARSCTRLSSGTSSTALETWKFGPTAR